MGGKVAAIVVSVFIVIANAIKVNIDEKWVPNFGWEVTCSWDIPMDDSLQSVRLSYNGMQFMIYRPEKHGPAKSEVFTNTEMNMAVDCEVSEPGNRKGECVVKVQPFQPPAQSFAVKCEVSGERPTFIMVEREHVVKALVPPSSATIVSKLQRENSEDRVSLNCSSAGLPAPNLLWTIDDDKYAQADFTGRNWNQTSKLWNVWSFLSYTPAGVSTVSCTPTATVDGETVKGNLAVYSSARRYLSATFLTSTAILVSQLLR